MRTNGCRAVLCVPLLLLSIGCGSAPTGAEKVPMADAAGTSAMNATGGPDAAGETRGTSGTTTTEDAGVREAEPAGPTSPDATGGDDAESDSSATVDLLAPPKWVFTWRGPEPFSEPSSVEHDTTGNVWVAPHDNKIEKFTFDGELIQVWGTKGPGEGQFNHPHGLAMDRKNGNILYVGDQENHRIQVFTNEGQFIRQFKNSDLIHIHDIGIDPNDGSLYAPDYEANHLQKIDPKTGMVIWKKTGLSKGWGVSVDSEGWIYLAASGSGELYKLDPKDGSTVKKIGGFSGGQGITGVYVDGHDLVYAVDAPKQTVFIYDTELNEKASWRLSGIRGISKPEDITISDDDRHVYIADAIPGTLVHLVRQ